MAGSSSIQTFIETFVAILIARIRLMGSWEMLLRAAQAKNGRGVKRGVILMALANVVWCTPMWGTK
jgi:hypothetical protein